MRVAAVGPFDPAPSLAALAAHAVPGLERVDAGTGAVTRLVDTGTGPAPVTVHLDGDGARVQLPPDVPPSDAAGVVDQVRWCHDLATDPRELRAGLGDDPTVGPLVRRRPGLRVLRHADGFESAIGAVVGQQVSVARARTMLGRLVAAYGTSWPSTGLAQFPTASRLADVPVDELREVLGMPRRRAATVQALARAVADGLVIGPDAEAAEVRRRLLALDGVGPWTVETVALRALGDDDAFPAGDLVLRRALGARTTRAAAARAAGWSPWRGRVAVHLWAELVYCRPAPVVSVR